MFLALGDLVESVELEQNLHYLKADSWQPSLDNRLAQLDYRLLLEIFETKKCIRPDRQGYTIKIVVYDAHKLSTIGIFVPYNQ